MTFGSGEEDGFLKVFTIYGHGGHIVHVIKTNFINLNSIFTSKKAPHKFRL